MKIYWLFKKRIVNRGEISEKGISPVVGLKVNSLVGEVLNSPELTGAILKFVMTDLQKKRL